MEYIVLEAASALALSVLVTNALEDGWLLRGDVVVLDERNNTRFFQAMTRVIT